MRCERCGETLVHEDEQVDGLCRKCLACLRKKAIHRGVRNKGAKGKMLVMSEKSDG